MSLFSSSTGLAAEALPEATEGVLTSALKTADGAEAVTPGAVPAAAVPVSYTHLGLIVPYPGIVLRSGSVGGCVRLVQQKLNAEGERLTTDGKFGASTVAAVKRYQTRHSLTSDGSVGKDTWEKMFPAA